MKKENQEKTSKIQVVDKGIDLTNGTQEGKCCDRSVSKL